MDGWLDIICYPVPLAVSSLLGYSMGGRGTWHLAAKFRRHFGAAIPIAGTPGEIALDTLRDLPLYVIHSEADRRVPIEDTTKAIEQLHAMVLQP